MFYVYKITNTQTNKIYIGKTNNIKTRWSKHQSAAKVKNSKDYSYLHKSINKWGANNFIIECIATFNTEQEALDHEIYFINLYNTTNRDIGYNISLGGNACQTGRQHTIETKLKISKANSGKIPSKETREKMSKSHLGSKRTPETKQKMREVRAKQAPMTDESKQKLSNSHKGKILSEHHKSKISDGVVKKLTDNEVKNIIDLLNNNKSMAHIARLYNVSERTIFSIKYGKRWKKFSYLLINNKQPKQISWPPNKQLVQLLKFHNYSEIGRMINATGAGVKKRIKKIIAQFVERL